MKKILISNIGNRNLKVNGKFIVKNFDEEDMSSFRDQTRNIWDKLQNNDFDGTLDPVILNEVIEKEKEDLTKVILFSSDMPENVRNDQDTFFEGEILCYILRQKYPEIEFVNVPIKASVFVHDELFRHYRRLLTDLKSNHKGKHVVYCDAGGTSQQKFSIKIALEYLFEPEQFTVYYVAQEQKGRSKLMRGESYEYRKIIEMEHVFQAIHSASYQLAMKLLANNDLPNYELTYQILRFLDFRSRFLMKEARKTANILCKKEDCPELVKDFSKGTPIGNFTKWGDLFSKQQFFQLCEILAIVQWKFSLGITEQAIHYFSMFIENYIYFALKNNFNYQFDINYESAYAKLFEDFDKGLLNFPQTIDPNKKGLPTLIELTSQINNENNVKISNCIKNLNARTSQKTVGIDTFRNNYAHKGLGIKKESLEKRGFMNDIKTCFNLMGMDFNRNYYDEMHQKVCEIIRN